jgi:hypothetical protein
MLPASLIPDFQLAELMKQNRIPKSLRPAYVRWLRTGRQTKRLAAARRKAILGPLDDNRFAMCALAIGDRGRQNMAEGIRSWTAGGQPLRVVA